MAALRLCVCITTLHFNTPAPSCCNETPIRCHADIWKLRQPFTLLLFLSPVSCCYSSSCVIISMDVLSIMQYSVMYASCMLHLHDIFNRESKLRLHSPNVSWVRFLISEWHNFKLKLSIDQLVFVFLRFGLNPCKSSNQSNTILIQYCKTWKTHTYNGWLLLPMEACLHGGTVA